MALPGSQVADRFRVALELYEVGKNMLRLRREQPEASAHDIDAEIAA